MEHPVDLVSQARALVRFLRDLLMEQKGELLLSSEGVVGFCMYLGLVSDFLDQAQKAFELYLEEKVRNAIPKDH